MSHRKTIKFPNLSSAITRIQQQTLLDREIVNNNLIESCKLKNISFLMSATTAWLKINVGKTLYDVEMEFRRLGLNAHIIADKNYDSTKFDLCIPGNVDAKLKYVAIFRNFPNEMSEFSSEDIEKAYLEILKNYNTTEEENLENLKLTGFSCAIGYAHNIALAKLPNHEQLKDLSIIEQLRWGLIKMQVEIVDLGKRLEKDIQISENKHNSKSIRLRILDDESTCVSLYSYRIFDGDGKEEEVSDIGELEYPSKTDDNDPVTILVPVHIKTYIANLSKKETTNPGPPVSAKSLLIKGY